jgi:hypothetical protein
MKPSAWLKTGLLALTLGAASAAQALVSVPTKPDGTIVWDGLSTSSSFSETYQFSLNLGPYSLTMTDMGFPQNWMSLTLQAQNPGGTVILGSLSTFGTMGFTTPAAGLYQAVMNGVPTAPGSAFGVTIAPVPEPEIWAMMVVGMGLVGFQVRRKARGLQPA